MYANWAFSILRYVDTSHAFSQNFACLANFFENAAQCRNRIYKRGVATHLSSTFSKLHLQWNQNIESKMFYMIHKVFKILSNCKSFSSFIYSEIAGHDGLSTFLYLSFFLYFFFFLIFNGYQLALIQAISLITFSEIAFFFFFSFCLSWSIERNFF